MCPYYWLWPCSCGIVLLQYPLDNYLTAREFRASFAVWTEEQAEIQAFQSEALQIKSEYRLRIEG